MLAWSPHVGCVFKQYEYQKYTCNYAYMEVLKYIIRIIKAQE